MLEKGHPALMSGKPSDEEAVCKWIPKKKHEVLKAKYKCLKKLFQIYDASVIGILPEPHAIPEIVEREERKHSRRRRSHRTKTDACAGTNELCEVTGTTEKRSIATAVFHDLKLQYASTSTTGSDMKPEARRDKFTQDSRDCLSIASRCVSEKECEYTQTSELLQTPHLVKEPPPKPTRFQMFLQRLLGIRREKSDLPQPPHVYAASDNIINDRYGKRRRRGYRFRRLRGAKKIFSETALRDGRNPVILTYVQSVQKNCLMDTTPRQCPFVGCRMIFYGIINYNDHLNVCHFTDRKFFCHYCHEGFLRECDKLVHENEHIGITKLNTMSNLTSTPSSDHQSFKVASLTQTEPHPILDVDEEKLKKIVSFFDKLDDPDEILAELKKSRHSHSNLISRHSSKTNTTIPETRRSDRNTHGAYSSVHLHRSDRRLPSSMYSDIVTKRSSASSLKCEMCGDNCDRKQRMNLNVGCVSDHRGHKDKYLNSVDRLRDRESEYFDRGSATTVRRVDTSSTLTQSPSEESTRSGSCDPSTNIVYYNSLESVRKPSVMDYMAKRARSGFSYTWEPGTKSKG